MDAANASTPAAAAGISEVHAHTPWRRFGKLEAVCYQAASASMTNSRPTALSETVPSLLDAAVARGAARRAVADEREALDYAALAERVAAAADILRAAGLGAGDRVALALPSSVAFVEGFLGVLAAGAAAFPVPPTARPDELRRLFADGRIDALVAHPDDERAAAPIRLAIDARGMRVTAADAAARRRPRAATPPRPADPALVAATSGTVARPHRVERTHANLWWEAANFHTSTGLGVDDVVLGVVPLSHAHGLGNALLAALRAGASLVLRPRFLRRQVLEVLARERVTVFPAVPFMLRMLAATDRRRRVDLSALRLCLSAGAPLPREVFTAFRERFGVGIRQLYGLTEAGSVTCDLADDAEIDPTTVGRPLGNVVVTIEDERGRPLASGATGEIVIRSPAAADGPETPLRTRDLGRLDGAGRLVVTGRTSLFINAAGNKVDPAEVEAALRAHPAVADAAAFGLAAAHGEQIVAAAVVLAAAATPDQLRAHCRERLAAHKVPRVLTFRDALPRSPLGKVLIGRLLADA
ncbi:MAG: AMP-binding protein [Deltaproteobacteria bacterium]|nr:AMP-binding protein [Deltaproteobacteria bacterium]